MPKKPEFTLSTVPKPLRRLIAEKRVLESLEGGMGSLRIEFDLYRYELDARLFSVAISKLKRAWRGLVTIIVHSVGGVPTSVCFAQ